MRVTIVCSVYPPALAAEAAHAAMLCRHLARHGNTVTLITSKMEGMELSEPGFEIRDVMPGWQWGDARQLRKELARSRPDAVLLIYLGAIYKKHPMISFLPTICRGLRPRPVVVTQFENTQASELKLLSSRIGRKLWEWRAGGEGIDWRYGSMLRDSDTVIALCQPHLTELARYHPAVINHSRVIPAPPLLQIADDPDGQIRKSARAEMGYGDEDFVVTYFGFIYPEKGVETVLEAVSAAADRVPRIKLLMIGGSAKAANPRDPGYADRMRDYAAKLGLDGRTVWTGHLDPSGDRASRLLHAADTILMPFLQGVRLNNSSYAVATSHGLPVITTRGPDIESTFVDRENVLLFAPGDSKAAADRIAEVANDPELRQALRRGSLAYANGPASWDSVITQTVEVLKTPRLAR